jgi:hypothetical protein
MGRGTDANFGEMTEKTWRYVTRLHQAILSYASEGEIKRLIAECVDVNQPDRLHWDKTPLHLAVFLSNVNVTEMLLRAGADSSATDCNAHTPLHDAAIQGKMDVITEILKVKGVNKNAVDRDGETALHFAASSGKPLATRLLMKAGLDLSIRNKDGLTAQEVARNERLRLERTPYFPKQVAELREVEAILEDTEDIANELKGSDLIMRGAASR